jgi:hypothetical protein
MPHCKRFPDGESARQLRACFVTMAPPLIGLHFGLRPCEIRISFSAASILLIGVSPENVPKKATDSGILADPIRAIRRAYSAFKGC